MNFDGVGPKVSKCNRLLCSNKSTKVSLHLHVRRFKTNVLHFFNEFEWLFINEIEIMYTLYYQC